MEVTAAVSHYRTTFNQLKLPMFQTDATQLSSRKQKVGVSFPVFFFTMPNTEVTNFPIFCNETDVLPETTIWCGNVSSDAEVVANHVN